MSVLGLSFKKAWQVLCLHFGNQSYHVRDPPTLKEDPREQSARALMRKGRPSEMTWGKEAQSLATGKRYAYKQVTTGKTRIIYVQMAPSSIEQL